MVIIYNIHEIVQRYRVNDITDIQVVDTDEFRFIPIMFFGRRYIIRIKLSNTTEENMNELINSYLLMDYERISRNLILPTIQKDDLFIDIGAAFGSWTLPACAMGAKVIAIDPNIRELELLVDQISYNSFESQVQIIQVSVGKKPMLTLDELEIDNLKLIKIDVEGAEFDVIEGGIETIKRFKPRLLVELHPFINGVYLEQELDYMKNIIPEYRSMVYKLDDQTPGSEHYHIYHYL